MDGTIVDRIYEAAVVTDVWPDVLRDIIRISETSEAVVIAARGESWRWISSSEPFNEIVSRHAAGSNGPNERTRRLVKLNRAGFVTDFDVFTPDEMLAEPLFCDFLIPRGYGSGVATLIQPPGGDALILHAERPFARGPISAEAVAQLDALRPHLARAALVAGRLQMERAQVAAKVLAVLGLAAAVLRPSGRVMAANDLFADLVPSVVQDRTARVTLTDPAADHLLANAVEQLTSSFDGKVVRSIPVAAGEQHPPMIIHVVPVRGQANDVFELSTALMVVTPVAPNDVPSAELVQGLFDLTPAEARIAREIGSGRTVSEVASAAGVSAETVRGQLKAVLGKTGLHRQGDLIALLQGASVPRFPLHDSD